MEIVNCKGIRPKMTDGSFYNFAEQIIRALFKAHSPGSIAGCLNWNIPN